MFDSGGQLFERKEGAVNKADWDILAYDISDLLSRNEYPIDISQTSILPNLPAFIEACLVTQKEIDKKEVDA
jgi:hypothetical protein